MFGILFFTLFSFLAKIWGPSHGGEVQSFHNWSIRNAQSYSIACHCEKVF